MTTANLGTPPASLLEEPAVANKPQALLGKPRRYPISIGDRLIYLGAIIFPFIGLGVAIGLLWGVGFSWVHLGLLLGMYVVSAFGVTVGYHRLFTHRSFTTNRVVKTILAILGSMATEGPLLKWVAQHRMHHQNSDAPGDPHSPHEFGDGFIGTLRGLWHAHVGWIFGGDDGNLDRYVVDLKNDGALRVVSNLFPLWVALGMFIPALLGGLITMSWMGALLGFIWGGLARVFFVHHITWSINSVCHFWGTRPYDCHDESRNNFIFGVIGFGEGWHNNHHAFPTSARHGLKWWQFDASYWLIRGMEVVGLADKVKVPPAAALVAKAKGAIALN
jgi:stearoyl-CoA desaturase (Delta-9 desaturase)